MVAVSSALIVATVVRTDIPWGVAVLMAIVVALIVGSINGLLVAYVGTPSFITTLATGVMLAGLELAITGPGSTFISGGTDIPRSYRNLGIGEPFLQIKSPVWIALGLTFVLWLLLAKTEVGRFMYAIGGNPEAARLSGIPVKFLRASGFVVVALCALCAGVVSSARTGSHVRNVGGSQLLPAFAAAFLGATLSKRGQFNVIGTLVGAIFLQVVESGLTFMGYDQDVKFMVKGGILIAAMLLGRLGASKR
jgi:ribose transport system permease protein